MFARCSDDGAAGVRTGRRICAPCQSKRWRWRDLYTYIYIYRSMDKACAAEDYSGWVYIYIYIVIGRERGATQHAGSAGERRYRVGGAFVGGNAGGGRERQGTNEIRGTRQRRWKGLQRRNREVAWGSRRLKPQSDARGGLCRVRHRFRIYGA